MLNISLEVHTFTFIAGISKPGLMESESCIQARKFSCVFVAAPARRVSRLMTCVSSGPTRRFATVPEMVWQLMQEVDSKR